MPFVNGAHFSKKSVEKDEAFLRSQGLNENQITAVLAYLLQRASGYAYLQLMMVLPLFIIFAIAWRN